MSQIHARFCVIFICSLFSIVSCCLQQCMRHVVRGYPFFLVFLLFFVLLSMRCHSLPFLVHSVPSFPCMLLPFPSVTFLASPLVSFHNFYFRSPFPSPHLSLPRCCPFVAQVFDGWRCPTVLRLLVLWDLCLGCSQCSSCRIWICFRLFSGLAIVVVGVGVCSFAFWVCWFWVIWLLLF